MSTQIQYRLVIGNVSSFYTVQWTRISFACWQSRTVHSPDDWEERSFRPHALMRAGSLRHPPGKSAFAVNWPSVPLCVDVASLPAIWRFCRLCELVCISDLLPPAALYLVPPFREFWHETNFGGGRCDPFRWFFDPSYIKHSNFSLTILIATFSTQLCDDVPI